MPVTCACGGGGGPGRERSGQRQPARQEACAALAARSAGGAAPHSTHAPLATTLPRPAPAPLALARPRRCGGRRPTACTGCCTWTLMSCCTRVGRCGLLVCAGGVGCWCGLPGAACGWHTMPLNQLLRGGGRCVKGAATQRRRALAAPSTHLHPPTPPRAHPMSRRPRLQPAGGAGAGAATCVGPALYEFRGPA